MDWLEYQVLMDHLEPQVHMDHLDLLEYLGTHQMLGLCIQEGGEHHVTVMLYCYIKVRESIIAHYLVLEKRN